jgi:hypothetical protein
MASHLDLLTRTFPGKIFLDVEDIAKCMNVSKGHIYNLSAAKELQFQLEWGVGNNLLVSIIDMANYLDTKLEAKQKPKSAVPDPIITVEPVGKKKDTKIGRPRSSAGMKVRMFQAELTNAIFKQEFFFIMSEAEQSLDSQVFNPSEEIPCVEKFDGMKSLALTKVQEATAYMRKAFLSASLPGDEVVKKTNTGKV